MPGGPESAREVEGARGRQTSGGRGCQPPRGLMLFRQHRDSGQHSDCHPTPAPRKGGSERPAELPRLHSRKRELAPAWHWG